MQLLAIIRMQEPFEMGKQVVGYVGPELHAEGKLRQRAARHIESAGSGIPESAVERMQHPVIGSDVHDLTAVLVLFQERLVGRIIIYEVVVFGGLARHGGRRKDDVAQPPGSFSVHAASGDILDALDRGIADFRTADEVDLPLGQRTQEIGERRRIVFPESVDRALHGIGKIESERSRVGFEQAQEVVK
ncbi:hypothetical protein DSECCO2_298780 [anaerobic digester metagenome]